MNSEITIKAIQLDEGVNEYLYMECFGQKLDKMDFFGKSDPFFEVWSGKSMLYRSEIIKKTLNPTWKPFEIAKVRMENPSLRVKVYDWDDGSANDFIGEFNLPDIECLEAGA